MEKISAFFSFTLFPLFAISLILLPSLEATSIKYCDKKDYSVKVKSVDITPDPVVSGSPATFKISASTEQTITGGKLVIDVSYFGVHVHSESHDLCEKSSCPINAGDFTLSHSQTLPGFTPPGSYTLTMTFDDEGGQKLTCISFGFKISLGSSFSS